MIPSPAHDEGRRLELARDRERLCTLAGELALKAGRHGVTVSDLRIAAVNGKLLTGEESERRMKELNLGAVMASAGLHASGAYRRSTIVRSRRNLHVVWVLPEFAEVAA